MKIEKVKENSYRFTLGLRYEKYCQFRSERDQKRIIALNELNWSVSCVLGKGRVGGGGVVVLP